MIKNLIIFGTRPEAIKMAPLIKEFEQRDQFDTKVCVTAQHREMLDQVLTFFDITPDYDLDLMTVGQTLHGLTARIINGLESVLDDYRPDFVYVHGDTTTSMAASIAAFYSGAKVCHVEAGLRTFVKSSPFPEEINRQITGRIADYHFAPTETSQRNLLLENIDDQTILITGNTVIDALHYSTKKAVLLETDEINTLKQLITNEKKIILVTGHRRENHGKGFENICNALSNIAKSNKDVQIIYPVHLNPKVKDTVYDLLSSVENIHLIPPLSYEAFIWLMSHSYIILTDSGGVQEEAPSLGKPVLVLRENTERPEAVHAGTVLLVGTDTEKIIRETTELLNDKKRYQAMAELHNPYGDGKACVRIADFIEQITHK